MTIADQIRLERAIADLSARLAEIEQRVAKLEASKPGRKPKGVKPNG